VCGIVGFVAPQAKDHKRLLREMRDTLTHRGPDDYGEYFDEFVALGHRRLTIIDLSPKGKNPIFSNDGRFVIVYNGEIFNYKEIREEIGNRYAFKSATDTEVVLAAYAIWGATCVDKFVGMFSFAIWDKKDKSLFCARDRFGIKPYYYLEHQGGFYFASEIKSLFHTGFRPKANYSTIYDYLKWGLYDHGEETFFAGVKKLEPGHILTYKNGVKSIRKYWDLGDTNVEANIDLGKAADRVWELLNESVRLALRSDVPVGVNLSGGFDSSLLLALIDSHVDKSSRLEGFTQDYRDEEFSERKWVVQMAKHTKRRVSFNVMDDKRFVDSLPNMLWYQDEPYAGVPVASYIGLYQSTIRRNVKVLLDGNGIDEAFCGYRQYHNVYIKQLAEQNNPKLNHAIDDYSREWNVGIDEARKIAFNNSDSGSRALVARDGTKAVEDSWLSHDFESNNINPYPEFLQPYESKTKNAMYMDLRYLKIPRALRFNDRISMAFSKELRVPFLDHRLIEFGMSIPDEVLLTGGRPKGLLRKISEGVVPDKVRLEAKRSVQTPQSKWFGSTMRSYLGDILHSRSFQNRRIFDGERAVTIFNGLEGKALKNSFPLWQAVHIEEWFSTIIDSESFFQKPGAFAEFEYDEVNYST